MTKKSIPSKPDQPPLARVERVMLALPTINRARRLDPFIYRVGVIEDYIGDEVLVRFGEVVIQVPAEWMVPAD